MMNKRYVFQKGIKVFVEDTVYSAFKRPIWRERKGKAKRAGHELSFDVCITCGFEVPSDGPPVDEIVESKLLRDKLISALNMLPDDERCLIDALFFEGKSERKLAAEKGCSKTNIHKQKIRILGKLRKLLS